MSSSSQNLAALNALFEPSSAEAPAAAFFAPAPATPHLPEVPTTLDAFIAADAEAAWAEPCFRWYRGVDVKNVVRIFRFQRGNSVAQWHDVLRTQRLKSIAGPFRAQQQAQAAR